MSPEYPRSPAGIKRVLGRPVVARNKPDNEREELPEGRRGWDDDTASVVGRR